ncbi:MAG: DNA-binding protein [Thermoleophilia bacterium]|nr:DNA-binding protein [Thermoleophilia bacterium]
MGELICVRCNVALVEERTELRYLDHAWIVKTLKCPKCGQVCLSEELVRGKISEVEMSLEDK